MEVAVLQELLLDARLHSLSEERPIGEDQSAAPTGFEQGHHEDEEQVGRLPCAERLGEVVLDAVLFHAAERRVGDDQIHAVLRAVVAERPGQRVVVPDVRRHLDAVEDHVRHTQEVRHRLLLNAEDARLEQGFVLRALHVLLPHVFDSAGEEAAGAARRIEHLLRELRVDLIDDELRDGTRRVVLARIPRALEVGENLLVDVPELVTVGSAVEVDLVELVDDLAHQRARLHVVVSVLEDPTDYPSNRRVLPARGKLLQRLEKVVVDEIEERLAGDAFGVLRPRLPA